MVERGGRGVLVPDGLRAARRALSCSFHLTDGVWNAVPITPYDKRLRMVDSFGMVLRQLRQDKRWSTTQMAARLGWSQSFVSLIESDRRAVTWEFAAACDELFKTAPFLTTLCGCEGEDHEMQRRALLTAFIATAGIGATASLAAMSERIRMEFDVTEDWDTKINDYRRRLVLEPTAVFGDQLLASMIVARQMMSEKRDPDAIRASAHLGLLYAVWMGFNNNLGTSQNYFKTAAAFAERSGDLDTHVYVLARTASSGPYQGFSRRETEENSQHALAIAGDRPSEGAIEAYAALVHLAALNGDLTGGRVAVRKMYEIAERLSETREGAGPMQRAASFNAYLEGKLGTMLDAEKAYSQAKMVLGHLPTWMADADLYYALAKVRHHHPREGVEHALTTMSALQYPHRVLRLGVDDVLRATPSGYRSDAAEALRRHGSVGPKPWELM